MIAETIYGETVYRIRGTSSGAYVDVYKVAEATGRKLDKITVVPLFVWEKFDSPYYFSKEIPAKDLVTHDWLVLNMPEKLHPAMTL